MKQKIQSLQFLSSFQDCCRNTKDVEPLARKYSQDYGISLPEILLLRDSRKRTPLHYACRANHPPISVLLNWFPDLESRNAALKLKDKDGITCLMVAVQHPNVEIKELLHGNKLGLVRSKAGATALHYAAGAGAGPRTIQLLWENAKVAIQTFALQGGTPLHWASSSSKEIPQTIRALMECGADVNASNESVPLPLALALAVGNEANVCSLLESSDIGVEVLRGQKTLFHMAVDHGLVTALEKMLYKLENKEILKHKDKNGKTVLDLAKQRGNSICVELLCSNGGMETQGEESIHHDVAPKVEVSHVPETTIAITSTSEDKSAMDCLAQLQLIPDATHDAAEAALFYKTLGNQHFQRKEWQEARDSYTKAIASHPKDATFYANRSACLIQLGDAQAALSDGTLAVGLKPDWTKAYYRKAVALLTLERYHDAALAAYQGLELEPSNVELQTLLRSCVNRGRKAFREAN